MSEQSLKIYAHANCLTLDTPSLLFDWMRRWELICFYSHVSMHSQMRLLEFAFIQTMKMLERDFKNVEMFFIRKVVVIMVILLFHFRKRIFLKWKVFLIHQRKQYRVEIKKFSKVLSLAHRGM